MCMCESVCVCVCVCVCVRMFEMMMEGKTELSEKVNFYLIEDPFLLPASKI